jgi:ATP-dependent Clp protease ATP-binding subunit ClpB
MDIDKYTDRLKGFIQSAQFLAQRMNHQQFTPEHLLKVVVEDEEGLAANLIAAAGGDPKQVLLQVDAELGKLPKVEGSGAGQLYMAPQMAKLFQSAEDLAKKAGDGYVTVERLLQALSLAAGTRAADILKNARPRTPTTRSRSTPRT